jgi:hypothetical protein
MHPFADKVDLNPQVALIVSRFGYVAARFCIAKNFS